MKANPLLLTVLIGACLAIPGQLGCGRNARSPVAPAGSEMALPQPKTTGRMSVEEALTLRRSVREFDARDLTAAQVSQLAWAAQGITDREQGFRTAPSAGALYPLEVYLVKRDGVFRYVPRGHTLVQRSQKDLRDPLSRAALRQSSVGEAPWTS